MCINYTKNKTKLKIVKLVILCYVNFNTIKNNNNPPIEKNKEGKKENCSRLMETREMWQLNVIYDCRLHPELGEK